MTPENILSKIKFLLNLQKSSNDNESIAAKSMADKLIEKYKVTEEELKSLEDKKPLYGDDEKVYTSLGIIGWKQQLLLFIGKYFTCQIVQEEVVPMHGIPSFHYYAYGETEDVVNVKMFYHNLNEKVENLAKIKCVLHDEVYVSSYCEGVTEAIKENIIYDGLEVPVKKNISSDEKVINNGTNNLVKPKAEKEKPAEKSVNINSQSLIKNATAYFKGYADGCKIDLPTLNELEYKEIKEFE